jgi:hypothetical protein
MIPNTPCTNYSLVCSCNVDFFPVENHNGECGSEHNPGVSTLSFLGLTLPQQGCCPILQANGFDSPWHIQGSLMHAVWMAPLSTIYMIDHT